MPEDTTSPSEVLWEIAAPDLKLSDSLSQSLSQSLSRSLSDGEVHLWRVALDSSGADVEQLKALLSEEEIERVGKGISDELRQRSVLARAALRLILGRYLGADPSSLLFELGEHGKPALRGNPIQFNLSHSGSFALIAVARDFEVGVDLECPSTKRDFDKLTTRFFTAEEAQAIQAKPPAERAIAFYRCWTRKESLLKAWGKGISGGLKSFSVSVESAAEPDAEVSFRVEPGVLEEAQDRVLRSIDVAAPYIAALALFGVGCESSTLRKYEFQFPG